ncbi:FmdB family zinc ribbon protein [Jiella mangrovi]|uniref:Zinc ribbon domain-containing protein n=1 Tax=Jiella mangrovi TaxID=2821407 RepID=A0ABS4BJQ9_9HYPH|nr:zinc ribbon domain-containing protein [Jiella mangrovi]MBP0617003.1 zinc ribbon domain-containing protein [Jiella mangrovi]
MPFYDYACSDCGTFTSLRPMAQAADPCACPDCGASARRVILTAPRLAMMDAGRRNAFATNERSSNAPRVGGLKHGAGCGCCGPKASSIAASAATQKAAKTFPGKRPWMISH